MKTINRNNREYLEIESFEKYELTNCIAYEMAIRNKKYFKEIIRFLNEKINEYESLIKNCKNENAKQSFTRLFANSIKSELCKIGIFNCSISDFLKLNIYKFNTTLQYICKHENKILGVIGNKDVNINENIFSTNLYDEGCDFNGAIYTEINFKRPKLIFDKSKYVETELNLSLPLDELLKLIEKLKEKRNLIYSSIEKIIKELDLNLITFKNMTSIEWADCFYIYDYFNKSKDLATDKYSDIIENLTAYHGYKVEKNKSEIKKGFAKTKIISYDAVNCLKDTCYKDKTIKNYCSKAKIKQRLSLMNELIKKEAFKNLI